METTHQKIESIKIFFTFPYGVRKCTENAIKSIFMRVNHLACDVDTVYRTAPQTNNKCYKIAQKRLNPRGEVEGEDFTITDEEIDRFLPSELKVSSLLGL